MTEDSHEVTASGADDRTITVKSDSLSRANDWINLAANVGVLLGLIALVVEIEQYRNATRLQVEVDASLEKSNIYMNQTDPVIAEAMITASFSPETLTDAQKFILDGYFAAALQRMNQLFAMYNAGIISEERLKADIANEVPFFLGSDFGLAWWRESEREGWYGPTRDYLDAAISTVDPEFNKRRFEKMGMTGAQNSSDD